MLYLVRQRAGLIIFLSTQKDCHAVKYAKLTAG
jgi:hypothetical protein